MFVMLAFQVTLQVHIDLVKSSCVSGGLHVTAVKLSCAVVQVWTVCLRGVPSTRKEALASPSGAAC